MRLLSSRASVCWVTGSIRVFIPTTRVPPQDIFSQQRAHELVPPTPARCVSPSLYLSETCMPTLVLKSLSHVHSAPSSYPNYNTPSSPCSSKHSECSAFPACPLRQPLPSSFSSNSSQNSRLRPKSSSHYSSNSFFFFFCKADACEDRIGWRSCVSKALLYTSCLAHWLTDHYAIRSTV